MKIQALSLNVSTKLYLASQVLPFCWTQQSNTSWPSIKLMIPSSRTIFWPLSMGRKTVSLKHLSSTKKQNQDEGSRIQCKEVEVKF